MALSRKDRKLLNDLAELEEKVRQKAIKTADKMERRYLKATAQAFEDMQAAVLNAILNLDTESGQVKDSTRNLNYIRSNKKALKEITNKLLMLGADYFNTSGIEIQELGQDAFVEKVRAIESGYGEKIDFSLISPAAFQAATNKSIIIYGDVAGKFADEITNIMVRKIIGGTSNEQLVNYYENIIPSIDKPKRGGGRYVLSAKERALMTVRTETNRLYNDARDKLAKDAFGPEYWVLNFNPMDRRTSSICAAATNAGLMKRDEMLQRFGLPPRHPRCRSSIGSVPDFVAEDIGRGNRP